VGKPVERTEADETVVERAVGRPVGDMEGCTVRDTVGRAVGNTAGRTLGETVGTTVGLSVGSDVGATVRTAGAADVEGTWKALFTRKHSSPISKMSSTHVSFAELSIPSLSSQAMAGSALGVSSSQDLAQVTA